MKNRETWKSYLALIGFHIFFTIGYALVFGLGHPFARYYQPNQVIGVIMSAIGIALPMYIVAGYLYVIGRNSIQYVVVSSLKAAFLFTVVLLVFYGISYSINLEVFNRNGWLVYVLTNYPIATVMNSFTLPSDMRSLWVIVTAFIPGLGFVFGVFLRTLTSGKGTDYYGS